MLPLPECKHVVRFGSLSARCWLQDCNADYPGICEIPKVAYGCPPVRPA